MKRHLLFALLLAATACQAEGLPEESFAALKAAFPKADLNASEWALGDLNGDGIDDLAVLVFQPLEPDGKMRVAALLRDNNGFHITTQSKEWETTRYGYSIGIKKGVLLLSLEGTSSCCSHYNHELKFKLRNGTFLLIGEEFVQAGSGSADDSGSGYMTRKSVNYLSREVIYSHKTDGKKSAPARKVTFDDSPLQLSEFSYSGYKSHFRSRDLNQW